MATCIGSGECKIHPSTPLHPFLLQLQFTHLNYSLSLLFIMILLVFFLFFFFLWFHSYDY